MQLVFEVKADEKQELEELEAKFPDEVERAEMHGVDGTEWLAFVVDMTKALAPHVFALLTIYITTRRKLIVIHNGERKELTHAELEKLKQEMQLSQSDDE